jgi:hypothetical protein
MKASDIPYVLLGLSILALVTSSSIWQTIRQRRSAQTAALDLHGVIESIARALNMRLDERIVEDLVSIAEALPSQPA